MEEQENTTSGSLPDLRARPERRSARARTEILDATARLLDKSQLHELSVEQIAQEAGVSRPTVYSYFASKLEIVLELYSLSAAALHSAVTPIWNRSEDQSPPDAIRQGIQALVTAWTPRRAVFRAAIEHRYTDPAMMAASQQTISYFAANIGGQVDADRAAGIAPAGPPTGPLVSTLLWSSEHALYIADRGLSEHLPDEYAAIVPLQTMWLSTLYGTTPAPP